MPKWCSPRRWRNTKLAKNTFPETVAKEEARQKHVLQGFGAGGGLPKTCSAGRRQRGKLAKTMISRAGAGGEACKTAATKGKAHQNHARQGDGEERSSPKKCYQRRWRRGKLAINMFSKARSEGEACPKHVLQGRGERSSAPKTCCPRRRGRGKLAENMLPEAAAKAELAKLAFDMQCRKIRSAPAPVPRRGSTWVHVRRRRST